MVLGSKWIETFVRSALINHRYPAKLDLMVRITVWGPRPGRYACDFDEKRVSSTGSRTSNSNSCITRSWKGGGAVSRSCSNFVLPIRVLLGLSAGDLSMRSDEEPQGKVEGEERAARRRERRAWRCE